MDIEIIFENKDFFILNKPAGILTHPTPKTSLEEKTISGFISQKYPAVKKVGDNPAERPGIVHRLDKDTSGIILVVKNQSAFKYFKNLFQERKITKTYLAVVFGLVKEDRGVIDKEIGFKSGTIKRSVFSSKSKKSAVTQFSVEKRFPEKNLTLLKVSPKTGRTHQIRVHLSSIGHPVLGDKIYSKKGKNFPHLYLHAFSLEFNGPDNSQYFFEADPPRYFNEFYLST